MAKQQAPEERQVIARGVSPGYSDKRTKPRPNALRSMKYILKKLKKVLAKKKTGGVNLRFSEQLRG
jgi:hypothetical protein